MSPPFGLLSKKHTKNCPKGNEESTFVLEITNIIVNYIYERIYKKKKNLLGIELVLSWANINLLTFSRRISFKIFLGSSRVELLLCCMK